MFGRKKKAQPAEFIPKAGGCVCTKSVLAGETPLRWCFREESINPADNGWRFIGRDDDEEYINVPGNNAVVDFNTVANIEPAVLLIYDMPAGTDVWLECGKDGGMRFYHSGSGEELVFDRRGGV